MRKDVWNHCQTKQEHCVNNEIHAQSERGFLNFVTLVWDRLVRNVNKMDAETYCPKTAILFLTLLQKTLARPFTTRTPTPDKSQ